MYKFKNTLITILVVVGLTVSPQALCSQDRSPFGRPDVWAAGIIPGVLVYLSAVKQTVAGARKNAQKILDQYYGHERAFTVETINDAHDTIKMSDEEVQASINGSAVFCGALAGFLTMIIYGAIVHGSAKQVERSSKQYVYRPVYYYRHVPMAAAAPAR